MGNMGNNTVYRYSYEIYYLQETTSQNLMYDVVAVADRHWSATSFSNADWLFIVSVQMSHSVGFSHGWHSA